MSNSSLATDTVPARWSAPRTHAIDRITIHHAAAVDVSAAQIAVQFSDGGSYASANYCIGTDGSIVLSVDEDRRALTSSSTANDNRAVTIEAGNSGEWPDWPVSEAAYAALLDLCEDICRRNGKTRMVWLDTREARVAYEPREGEMGMTVHRDFAATACPGEYLLAHMPDIAEKVTRRLTETPDGAIKDEEETMRYNTIGDLPAWAAPTIRKLCDRGTIQGYGREDGEGYPADMNLSEDMVRLLIILDREKLFDGEDQE